MELSVAIYQNNPSKVGKTIRLDSKYNRAGNNSKSGKDDFVDESHFLVDIYAALKMTYHENDIIGFANLTLNYKLCFSRVR